MRKKDLLIPVIALFAIGSFFVVWQIERNTAAKKLGLHTSPTQNVVSHEQNKTITTKTGDVFVQDLVYHSVYPYHLGMTADQKTYDVETAAFELQMQYLKEHGFTSITFTQYADHLFRNKSLPPKPVLITLDDGWQTQFDNAFPLLQKYGMTATFFVYTQPIGHKKFLTWDELRTLEAAGMDVEAHTLTHPRLDKITDEKILKSELEDSKAKIEKELSKKVLYFAYPFGKFTDHVVVDVRAAGYEAARTITHGKVGVSEDVLKLHGAITTGDMNMFAALMGK